MKVSWYQAPKTRVATRSPAASALVKTSSVDADDSYLARIWIHSPTVYLNSPGASRAGNVPKNCSRIRGVDQLDSDPQVEALELLLRVPHPTIPDLRLVDLPLSIDGKRACRRETPRSR